MAVNLSAHDLSDSRLINRIGGLFSTWGVALESIQFELSETALMEDPASAYANAADRVKDWVNGWAQLVG